MPVLGAIPLLGNLFKSRSGSRQKSNLLVFMRPKILRDQPATEAVSAEKYNEIRDEERIAAQGQDHAVAGREAALDSRDRRPRPAVAGASDARPARSRHQIAPPPRRPPQPAPPSPSRPRRQPAPAAQPPAGRPARAGAAAARARSRWPQ